MFLDYYNGLTSEHIESAVNILNDKLGFNPFGFDCSLTSEEICIRFNKYHNSRKKVKEW